MIVAEPRVPEGPAPVGLAPVVDQLEACFGARAQRHESLAPRCTYRVGGAAAVLVTVETSDELDALAAIVGPAGVPTLVIGRGSNLLVADTGFEGVAVVLGEEFAGIELGTDALVAGAAAALPVVARRSAAAGWRGFEWAVGVPGTVGGAVAMNAGGHGSDMAASLLAAEVVDLTRAGSRRWVGLAELQLGYRSSALGPHQIVVRARLGLTRGDRAHAETLIAEIVAWRRANQPGGPNAGSVFTNPPGDSAGRLIEAAGAKGLRVGSAEVSNKHANFIQADPDGSAEDVYALMGELRRRVLDVGGPLLEPETRLIGFSTPLAPRVGPAGIQEPR